MSARRPIRIKGWPAPVSPEWFAARTNLVAPGNLNLSHTGVAALPEGLMVGGNLNLVGTTVTHFPKGLLVVGNIIMSHPPTAPCGAVVLGKVIVRGPYVSVALDGTLYLKNLTRSNFSKESVK